MKTFNFILILLLSLFIIQCKVKTINTPLPVQNLEETTVPEVPDTEEATTPEASDIEESQVPEMPDIEESIVPEVPDTEESSVLEIPDSQESTVPDVQETTVVTMPMSRGRMAEDGTISVTVKNYDGHLPIEDVELQILIEDAIIARDTTDSMGQVTISNVDSMKQYKFVKEDFSSQSFHYVDFENIEKMDVYLKPVGGSSSVTKNIRGFVFDSAGNPVDSVSVISNEMSVITSIDGSYSLDISHAAGTIPLDYIQGDINGSFKINSDQDSILVDVFIDGFSGRVSGGN